MAHSRDNFEFQAAITPFRVQSNQLEKITETSRYNLAYVAEQSE